MSDEAERLRQQCDRIMAIRHWLQRIDATNMERGCRALSEIASRLESELLTVEGEIMDAADRLDPPPTRYTGQQWLAGLTRRIGS